MNGLLQRLRSVTTIISCPHVIIHDGLEALFPDGIHDLSEAQGTIPLGKGLHFYKLVYFDDEGDQELTWSWKAPGAAAYAPVPANRLYFK